MRRQRGIHDVEAPFENLAECESSSSSWSMPSSKSRRQRSILQDDCGLWKRSVFLLIRFLLLGMLTIWSYQYYSVDDVDSIETCEPPFVPISFPDTITISSLSQERQARLESVQNAIQHAWKGYRDHVFTPRKGSSFLKDDLAPLSQTGISWLNYAATPHDALDTLFLANLTVEYEEAVDWLAYQNVQSTSLRVTKTFEYSLRILGGLLGAYSVSGDPRLLGAAQAAADSLWEGPFRASPTVLPRPFGMLAPSSRNVKMGQIDWWKGILYRIYARLYEWGRDTFTNEHQKNSLAGVGSFALEFHFLSILLDDPIYQQASDDIFNLVKTVPARDGTVPTEWNVMTGKPSMGSGNNLGSGADSFYEYLLKVPVLKDCLEGFSSPNDFCSDVDLEMLAMYRTIC